MSTTNHPLPPEAAGWYAVNFRTDPIEAEPGQLICPPQIVFYDPDDDDENVCYDPLGPERGGIQGIEEVAVWGQRVEGIGRDRLTPPRATA